MLHPLSSLTHKFTHTPWIRPLPVRMRTMGSRASRTVCSWAMAQAECVRVCVLQVAQLQQSVLAKGTREGGKKGGIGGGRGWGIIPQAQGTQEGWERERNCWWYKPGKTWRMDTIHEIMLLLLHKYFSACFKKKSLLLYNDSYRVESL